MSELTENKKENKDYSTNKKREVIKNVLIVFLGVLLILTFFSNTIMNRSLAEVSTERANTGKLTERIRGSGMVESNQSYGVTVEGNKVVDTVMVKVGKEVKKGDVLFTVGTGESEELTAAEDVLEALELEYQKSLLAPPADYTTENQAIKNAREDLNEAIRKRDNAIANQGNEQAAKNDYKNDKAQLAFYTKLQSKLSAIVMAIDTDEYTAAPAEYSGDLIAYKNEYTKAQSDYTEAYDFYMALTSGGSSVQGTTSANESGLMTFAEVQTEETTEEQTEEPTENTDLIDSARADMESKRSLMITAKENYENLKSSLRQEYSGKLSDAEYYVDYYSGLVEDYESNAMGDGMTVEALNEDVKAKQRTLEDLITTLNKTMKDDENQDKLTNLDLEAKKKEIEKARKKVEKLKKENDTTEVKSKHDGVVNAVNIKAGDTTVPDMELVSIDIAEEGYTLKITVDAEKTKKIKKGVEAEVVNNWSGGTKAVLTDIKNDTVANSKNRILVFSVTGDVSSGGYLDLSIPCGSGTYDTIVPKSAIHDDNNGNFVLVVQSKSSPLGNRYYAKKVPVEVVASDEVSSAIMGNINSSDYVLTASSAPVKSGDQVRMKEK